MRQPFAFFFFWFVAYAASLCSDRSGSCPTKAKQFAFATRASSLLHRQKKKMNVQSINKTLFILTGG
jgi:hypothetical protein